MVDVKRIDDVMVNVARARVALGAAAFVAPGLSVRAMGMGRGSDAGRDYVARMFAAREIALGAGYLLSSGDSRKLWARLGLVVDSLDTVNGVKSRGRLPLWLTGAAVAVAGGTALAGAAKVGRDLVSAK